MIEVEGLRKAYGDIEAVKGVSFAAKKGQVFGLLGPNGAGKSTTINCLSGLIKPTAGSVRVGGHDIVAEPEKAKAALGVVPQELAIYEDLSARDNLAFWGAAYGLKGKKLEARVLQVLQTIGLADRARELPKKYSGGMKRRLNFGCGIVHEPKILLLDEPTVGVDPQSRGRLFDLVVAERAKGTCVLYTTHYLEEAEQLCDEIAIIDHGAIIARGTLADLRSQVGERDLIQLKGAFDPKAVEAAVKKLNAKAKEPVEVLAVSAEAVALALKSGARRLPEVLTAVAATRAEIRDTRLSEPSLETLFLKLTGKTLRE